MYYHLYGKKNDMVVFIFIFLILLCGCGSTASVKNNLNSYSYIQEYSAKNMEDIVMLNVEDYLLQYKSDSEKTSFTNLQDFSISDVKLLDDYYLWVTQKDVDFLNTFNPDKLLYNFRLTAGYSVEELKKLNQNTGSYSGWENTRIGGHTMGHYITAAAQAVAGGYGECKGDDGISLSKRLEIVIDGLADCQKKNDELCAANPNRNKGFIFGATMADSSKPELQFDKVESTNASDTWVPWYNLHKVINGLVEVWKLTENRTSLEIAEKLGEWVYHRTSNWTEQVQDRVLGIEYGGMNDCLYELYKAAVSQNYSNSNHILFAAHQFDEVKLFTAINQTKNGAKDVLNNRHANTTIPKYMGALNRYRTLKTDSSNSDVDIYLEYVENFWNLVVNNHSYITGGNSECEHFGKDNILDGERSNCNNETCNTHNMLKITRELFKITGDKKYADYYENTFLNSIMASVNSETGMTAYFQPMASGCFKTFCNPDVNKNYFWCCTGTGLENFTKLGDSFYFHNEKALIINQYISSVVNWNEKGFVLSQKSLFPEGDSILFTVEKADSKYSPILYFRVPDWISKEPVLSINSEQIPVKIENGYIKLENNWKSGDVIQIKLSMEVKAYTLPDNGGNVFGFKYGPLVLAAELGADKMMNIRQVGVMCDVSANKIIRGELMALNGNYGGTSNLKTLSGETLSTNGVSVSDFIADIKAHLVKTSSDDKKLSFSLKDTNWNGTGDDLIFSPYYKLQNQRYGIYWLFADNDKSEEEKILEAKNSARDSRVYLDGIGIGYGAQTEGNETTFPCMKEEGDGSQADSGALTRFARKNGSFSYLFVVNPDMKNYLICGFLPEDDGKSICMKAEGIEFCNMILDSTKAVFQNDEKYLIKFELPQEAVRKAVEYDGKKVIRISFSGKNGEESAKVVAPAKTCTEYSHNAGLEDISFIRANAEELPNGNYSIFVPENSTVLAMKVKLSDKNGLLYINEKLVNDSKEIKIDLKGSQTIASLKIYAEDQETYINKNILIVKK